MKKAVAIVLSLMIVWLQGMSSADTHFRPASADNTSCNCNRNCCVSGKAPDAQPPPAAPATGGSANDFSLFAPALVTWTLPASMPHISSSASAPLSALAVPLFMQHCALLI